MSSDRGGMPAQGSPWSGRMTSILANTDPPQTATDCAIAGPVVAAASLPMLAPPLDADIVLTRLALRHPRLFHGDLPGESQVAEGWVTLVDTLCTEIGAALDDAAAARFRVHQIKTKAGALRVYWSLGSSSLTHVDVQGRDGPLHFQARRGPEAGSTAFLQIEALVRCAEERSVIVCEHCGLTDCTAGCVLPAPARTC